MQCEEAFFDLFDQGIRDITEARQPQVAFANLNAAFDYLKGVLVADHPIIFYRLAVMLFVCRGYPKSDIARQVCRLLAVHLSQLGRVVLGSNHPINHWWSTGIKLLDSGQWEHADAFLQSAQVLGSRYIAYVPGTVDLITYAPSEMRGLKDDVLRDKLENIGLDTSRVSEAQEARLCLSELLLGQGEIPEGLHILREACMLRHLDLDRPARKAFWFSELFSRATELDEALEMLKEAIELVKGENGVGEAAFSMALDEVQISDAGNSLMLKHKALQQGILTINQSKYLVDVGFGAKEPTHPILLKDGHDFSGLLSSRGRLDLKHLDKHSVEAKADPSQRLWIYSVKSNPQADWEEMYSFTETEFFPEDFAMMSYFVSTRPDSWFVQEVVAYRMLMDQNNGELVGEVALHGDVLKIRLNGKEEVVTKLRNEEERIKALAKEFDIQLTEREQRAIIGLVSEIRVKE
ncbi:hypothetical protein N0V82_003586 [Gnomoniopsis sp. IMI 355080]|nr:hypothetical protein N0V82_003586 [Gnomoniopsis sp. IMI 355080]